ncbi:MAG TPA: low-specificity L-threonine aldolase, partial [Chloroflexota bacterium]
MTITSVELRSDTFTRPTESMRRAMYRAEVGDDVWGEDPTIIRLEERAAQLTGKEAGLFVSSGTQGNLVGLLSHTRPGDEVILGDQSHIVWYECGSASVVGGLQLRVVANTLDGRLEPEDVGRVIRRGEIAYARTGCVAVENTHNRCFGSVISPEAITTVANMAHEAGVPVHMDGARLFNAVVALNIPAATFVSLVDSVTICLSKGLGAPVGSVLCGSRPYVERARAWRKLLGGGMRQAGVLAAAGLVALDEGIERLAEDHANARVLAEGLSSIHGIDIDPDRVESNIVYFNIADLKVEPSTFVGALASRGVRLAGGGTVIRAVTCYEVDR